MGDNRQFECSWLASLMQGVSTIRRLLTFCPEASAPRENDGKSEKWLEEVKMCQLDRLQQLRNEILQIARKHNAEKVYVFGSCARKEETPESDVDLLVDFNQDATLFDQIDIQDEMNSLLDCKVDVVSRRGLHPYIKRRVLAEAIEL